ncbi:MAG: ribonuclease H-like domain-containing protein [Deltaproteobacteria bacterium]|nr:ribonuclease H-like domain-containing protein [Deltaproteobacteria bacterium]
MQGTLVFDLETKKSFAEIGSRSPKDLGVTVCCLYDYQENQYHSFVEHELSRMENYFLDARLLVGFNIRRFDLPALQPYFSIDVERLPVFDILEDLTQRLGHRIALDSVAHATLNIGKSASGLEAIKFYREGRWEELKAYCQNDVKITKDVFDYGLEHGEVFYLSRDTHKKIRVSVNWREQIPQVPLEQDFAQYKLL